MALKKQLATLAFKWPIVHLIWFKDILNTIYICIFVFRAEAVTLNDCLQLSYLPSKRSHMLLLYPREILILDLELSQTVGVVAIERSGVPFVQVC